MKATDGLSELAKCLLELAGNQLSKKDQRMLWSLRKPATAEEVEALYRKVHAEWLADLPAKPRREKARLELLRKLNEKADEK